MVYGIASDQSEPIVQAFIDSLHVQMPILMDPNTVLDEVYFLDPAFATASFPKNWLIGPDGRFVYGSNVFLADELTAEIEALLP